MTNPMKGEATVRVSTGEFTMAFTFGAGAAIEAEFGKPLQEVLARISETNSITDMMKVIWAGLRKHHSLSLDEVGDLVTMAEAEIWGRAIGDAMGDPKAEGDETSRPPKAKAR